jgi:hypothetical protein
MLPKLRALNNFTMSKPAKRRKKTPAKDFKLVKKRTQFNSSEEVMRFLPDILGRALAHRAARGWCQRLSDKLASGIRTYRFDDIRRH